MKQTLLQIVLLPLVLLGFLCGFLYEQVAQGFRKGLKIGETYP